MGRAQNIHINRSLEKLMPTLVDDSEGFKISVEEGTADAVETAGELELGVEPEDVPELLQSQDQTLMDEELLLTGERRKWFLEMDLLLLKTLWRLLKWQHLEGLEYDKNLVVEQQGLRRLPPILKEVLLWVKCYQTAFMLQRSHSWREESIDSANFLVVLFLKTAAVAPAFCNHHPDQSAATNIQARPSTSKKIITHWRLIGWLAFCSKKVFLIRVRALFFLDIMHN